MKGVFYSIAKRKVVVEEVPPPPPQPGRVLIKVLYSAISVGTEGHTVSLAKSPVKILRERGGDVMKLLAMVKDFGPLFVYHKARSRAQALSPLGYSISGVVLEDSGPFKRGEPVVAVGGQYAHHMEVVSVPHRLVVKATREDRMRELSLGAIASVALHAVRRAEIQPGERALVVGLGVVGQIIARLLRIWDVDVYATDLDPFRREVASRGGVRTPSKPDTDAYDVVFIAAPDRSGAVVRLAGRAVRDRGKVVAVAPANYDFPWKDFYYKEVSLLVSRSYGPGRYDPTYEELGHDYPPGYVRWTEERNLQYVVRLVEEDKLDLSSLITHEFPVDEAPKAYELITSGREPFVGVVLKYPGEPNLKRVHISKLPPRRKGVFNVALIGAGSYAQGFILPHLKGRKDVQLFAVATSRGHTAKSAADIWGFPIYATDYREILRMDEVDLVFVLTRHATHARIVVEALEAGKAVHCEKPLAITYDDLMEVRRVLEDVRGFLSVGFNRRFSPHTRRLLSEMGRPFQMVYRVDAGPLPKDHWIHREGGRLVGEGIHFVDYALAVGGIPTAWEVVPSGEGGAVMLTWADGSVATILYATEGSKYGEKERVEVMASGKTAIISDFRITTIDGRRFRTSTVDKGQRGMLDALFEGLREGRPPIPYDQLFRSHEILLTES
ncbi:MAG: Gfo/Idh/MocA family oxidoreductase [Thermotogae bacterium]|nr:Gfo/Idh/MocA family oxidoreductase [Thermotogota bacterium]